MPNQPLRPSLSEALPIDIEQHISFELQIKQANNETRILMDNFWTKFGGSQYSVQAPTTSEPSVSEALPMDIQQHISFEPQMKQANNETGILTDNF